MNPYWIRCSETQLADLRQASQGVAMLPLASIESHGPHLPLGSDPLVLEHILQRVLKRQIVATLPVLTYSYVASARALPGAIHMPSDLLMQWVERIGDEVHRNGFDKFVLLHGHGGNVALDTMFCARMFERDKPYAVYSIPVFGSKGQQIADLYPTPIGHACEMETGMNMVANPELVHLQALENMTYPTQSSPDVGAAHIPMDWASQHPRMVVGEPRGATPQGGEAAIRIWSDEIVEILGKIKKDQLSLAELRRYNHQAQNPV